MSRLIDLVRTGDPEREISDDVESLLAERVAHAAAAWPGVNVHPKVFLRAIAERLHGDNSTRAIGAMHTDDLYLACGCAAGDPIALAGFESSCGATIARAIAASGAAVPDRADLGQVVRQRLLVTPAQGGAPRIATYSAQGALRTWVRVVATREAARLLPRRRREDAAGDDQILSLVDGNDDPEIAYLKRTYRAEFKRAFQAAIDALDGRDRVLLQQHTLDGLGIDQLARLHGVHRATAARRIQSARDAVLAGTQRELIRRLRLSRSELPSVIRLIHSQLDISLPRVLRRSA